MYETITLIAAIFSVFAFAIMGGMLKHYELEQGPWIILAIVTLLFTLGIYVNDLWITVAMVLLSLIALVKFWSIMRLTQ